MEKGHKPLRWKPQAREVAAVPDGPALDLGGGIQPAALFQKQRKSAGAHLAGVVRQQETGKLKPSGPTLASTNAQHAFH